MKQPPKRGVQFVEAPVVAGKVPPHDLDLEGAVLSACMLDAAAIDEVADVLRPEHFYSESNRAIYDAIMRAHAVGVVDIVTVHTQLVADEMVAAVGGIAYLAQLVDKTPAVLHARDHAVQVRKLAKSRRLIAAAHVLAASGYGADPDAFADEFGEKAFAALEEDATANAEVTLKDALTLAFKAIANASSGKSEVVPTGYVDIDRKVAMGPGDLIVVAARPGMGKSGMVTGIATHVAAGDRNERGVLRTDYEGNPLRAPGTVAIFSLEMPKEQIAQRIACAEARVDLSKLRTGHVTSEDWEHLTGAAAWLSALPIVIDDSAGRTLLDIRSACRRIARGGLRSGAPLRLVIVDYLQLMSGPGETREQEVANITRGLKRMAKELRVPVIALSQLNRGCEERGKDKRPILSDLRESGSIEQDSDAVLFLYRDEYYFPDTTDARGLCEVHVAKQRNGPTGRVVLRFVAGCARFENLAPEDYDAMDQAAE